MGRDGRVAFGLVLALGFALIATPSVGEPFAYVTNSGSNTVSVIDTATNSVLATIAVETQPMGIAVTPDGKRLYVANKASNSISVVDVAHRTVSATIKGSEIVNPYQVAISPDGKRVYVLSNVVLNNVQGDIVVINTDTNSVVANISIGRPTDLVVTPDGKRLYVTTGGLENIEIVDTATNTVKPMRPQLPGAQYSGLAVSSDGKYLFVVSPNQQYVVISTETYNNAIYGVSTLAQVIALSPDMQRAYIAGLGGSISYVQEIDTASPRQQRIYIQSAGSHPGIAADKENKHVYFTNSGLGTLSVVDVATYKITQNIPVGAQPIRVVLGVAP